MADVKFTPGPWDFERTTSPMDLPRPWVGRLDENRYSALACGETHDEAVANAHLIAAAPDLYEALDRLLAVAEMTTFSDQYPAECESANAALAKARGEQVSA